MDKKYKHKYHHNGIIYNYNDINKQQLDFKQFVGTEIEKYIKDGSLKNINNATEIYIKLPNWGDVKLYFYKHFSTFIENEKVYDENGEEKEPIAITIEYKFLITTLKVKVIDGDNSGYKKHYFVPLCWLGKEDLFCATIDNCVKTINLLLKNNSIEELDLDCNAIYFDMMGGGGI